MTTVDWKTVDIKEHKLRFKDFIRDFKELFQNDNFQDDDLQQLNWLYLYKNDALSDSFIYLTTYSNLYCLVVYKKYRNNGYIISIHKCKTYKEVLAKIKE